jgi:hypothetical protein
MTRPMLIFSHGQESGPWGTKINAMADTARDLGCEIDSVDYQGIADPTARVEYDGIRGPDADCAEDSCLHRARLG